MRLCLSLGGMTVMAGIVSPSEAKLCRHPGRTTVMEPGRKLRREYLARIAKTTATSAQVLASSATATGDR
jgi:hypothetical protein